MVKAIIFDCFGVLATDIWLAFCESLPASADLQRARDLFEQNRDDKEPCKRIQRQQKDDEGRFKPIGMQQRPAEHDAWQTDDVEP